MLAKSVLGSHWLLLLCYNIRSHQWYLGFISDISVAYSILLYRTMLWWNQLYHYSYITKSFLSHWSVCKYRCPLQMTFPDAFILFEKVWYKSSSVHSLNFSRWEDCFDLLNTLRPRQHGRHFADYTFKLIFLNENFIFSNKISLKFVPKGPINNIPALIQIMAWRRLGDKPLSEAMMVSLLTHICVTWPKWVNITDSISTLDKGMP